ncbi:MAG: hypothetical protein WC847_00785 [Candidatus Paceibacterota bacterium]|jgi:hypothetical protein
MEDFHGSLYGKVASFRVLCLMEDGNSFPSKFLTQDHVLAVIEKYQKERKLSGAFYLVGRVSFDNFISGGRSKLHLCFDGDMNEHYGVHHRTEEVEGALEELANVLMDELGQDTADIIFCGYGRTLKRDQESPLPVVQKGTTEPEGKKLTFWEWCRIFIFGRIEKED